MTDTTPSYWRQAARLFSFGLGKDRVSVDKTQMILRFKPIDRKEMLQMNRFGQLATENKIPFKLNVIDDTNTELLILRSAVKEEILYTLARDLEVRVDQKPDGELHRPITPHDKEYVLQELTGVPWRHVINSPYDGAVVEAVLAKPVEVPLRAKQEYGVAHAVRPDGNTLSDVSDWISHQRKIEETGKIAPRTMLPASWVNREGIDLANGAKQSKVFRESLPKVFEPSR